MLNRDLLLTAAMFHDIGKLTELSTFPANDYTDDGQLLGHIMIGAMEVQKHIDQIEGFPKRTASELIHCILAHHGELEYGSPKNRRCRGDCTEFCGQLRCKTGNYAGSIV